MTRETGWIAIPHAALAAAGREGRLAVLDLWERADRTGYAWLLWTERELAADWGVDRRVVRRVVEALEEVGLLEVERAAPGSRQSSRLRVVPSVDRPEQNGNQTRNQSDRGRAPVSRPPEPVAEPVAEPSRAYGAPARQDQTRPDRSDPPLSNAGGCEPAPVSQPSAGLQLEADVAELLALQEAEEPEHGMCQPRDVAAVRRTLAGPSPASAADLRALWAWSGVSDDALVAGCRVGGWRRWSSLLRQPSGPARIAAARAWDAAGRPGPALPTPRQDRPERPRAHRPGFATPVRLTPEQARAGLVTALLEGQPGWWLADDEDTHAAWREAMAAAPHLHLDRRQDCPFELLPPDLREQAERQAVAMMVELGGAPLARESLTTAYGAERVEQLLSELGAA